MMNYGIGERYTYSTVAIAARDEEDEDAVEFSDGRVLYVPEYWVEEEETFPPDYDVLGVW
jgi:hypothetical protein